MTASSVQPHASRRSGLLRALSTLTYPLNAEDMLDALWPQSVGANYGRVEAVVRNGLDAVTVTVRRPRDWSGFRAGQFVNVGVDIDGVRHTRCYSISSAPERQDGCFTITVKAVSDGRVSNHLVDNLRVGDRLALSAPTGEFVLPETLPQKLLLVAAGSGITPIISMLRSLEMQGKLGDIVVIYSAPSDPAAIHGADLQQLADAHPSLQLIRFLTQEPADGARRGRFDPMRLGRLCPDWTSRQIWACGPEALLQGLESACQKEGVVELLHVERFRPALRASVSADAREVPVSFTRSAMEVSGSCQQNLLELAEAQGLSPEHGCRMGICHGCTVTLTAGTVKDLRNGRTYDEPGDLVQICVCAPVSPVEIEL